MEISQHSGSVHDMRSDARTRRENAIHVASIVASKEFGAFGPLTFPFDDAIEIAKKARPLLARTGNLLFHGTPTPQLILADNALRCPQYGSYSISFTRLLHVGIYWATLDRDMEDQREAVLVLDRNRLAQNYKLEPYRDDIWDEYPERRARRSSEAEEVIYTRDVCDLRKYLIDVIWFDPDGRLRSSNRERDRRSRRRM